MLDEVGQVRRAVPVGGDDDGVYFFAAQVVGLREHRRHLDGRV